VAGQIIGEAGKSSQGTELGSGRDGGVVVRMTEAAPDRAQGPEEEDGPEERREAEFKKDAEDERKRRKNGADAFDERVAEGQSRAGEVCV